MPAGPKRRPHDAAVPHLDATPASEHGERRAAAGAAAAELVGLHRHLDATRATL